MGLHHLSLLSPPAAVFVFFAATAGAGVIATYLFAANLQPLVTLTARGDLSHRGWRWLRDFLPDNANVVYGMD